VAVHGCHDYNAVDDSQRTVQPMTQHLGLVSLVVRDYDEAIDFYVNQLGFRLIEDSPLPEPGKRWVVVAPDGSGCGLCPRARDDRTVTWRRRLCSCPPASTAKYAHLSLRRRLVVTTIL
jgi:catechol 2,3-dioxygenase-like lactoylglutathione lyase family enzyme